MTAQITREALDERIVILRTQLEAEQEKLRQFDELTPLQQLATDIHELTCREEHTETCGWYYEKWTGDGNHWTRARYVEKALDILTITDADTALAVLTAAQKF